jgi:LemA protein
MLVALVVLFLLLALSGYLVGVYNGLVRVRNAVKLAWSNIDVLLAQRHDELPKLVEVCRQYMKYESDTLERVMRARAGVDSARASGSVASLGPAERDSTACMRWRRTIRS